MSTLLVDGLDAEPQGIQTVAKSREDYENLSCGHRSNFLDCYDSWERLPLDSHERAVLGER